MEYSIWGEIQHNDSLRRCVRVVSTAGHGGMLLSKRFAEKNLPEDVIMNMPFYNGYYCFEEDRDFTLPFFFIPTLIIDFVNSYSKETDEIKKGRVNFHVDTTLQCMELYFPEILEKYRTEYEPLLLQMKR